MHPELLLPITRAEGGVTAEDLVPALLSLWTDQVHYLAMTSLTQTASDLLSTHLDAMATADGLLLRVSSDDEPLARFALHLLALAMGMERDPAAELLTRAGWTGTLPTLANAARRAERVGSFDVEEGLRAIEGPCRCPFCGLVHAHTGTIGPLLSLLQLPETAGQAAELLRNVLEPGPTLLADLLDAADRAAPTAWNAMGRCLYEWLPRLPVEAFQQIDDAWDASIGRQGVVLPTLAAQGDQRSKLMAFVIEHIDDGGMQSRVAVDVATALGPETMSSLTPTLVALMRKTKQDTVRESVLLGWMHTWQTEPPPHGVLDVLDLVCKETNEVGSLARMLRAHWQA